MKPIKYDFGVNKYRKRARIITPTGPRQISLIQAVLSSSLVATIVAGWFSIYVQTDASEERRKYEDRKIRTSVYQGFLDDADMVDENREFLAYCVRSSLNKGRNCGEELQEAADSINRLVRRQGGLQISGSKRARDLSVQILEESAVFNDSTGKWAPEIPDPSLNNTRYGTLRRQFLVEMCRDVGPLPRGDC